MVIPAQNFSQKIVPPQSLIGIAQNMLWFRLAASLIGLTVAGCVKMPDIMRRRAGVAPDQAAFFADDRSQITTFPVRQREHLDLLRPAQIARDHRVRT